jgi:hypothetical protein
MFMENIKMCLTKKNKAARCQWLTPVILATWEAEIERLEV